MKAILITILVGTLLILCLLKKDTFSRTQVETLSSNEVQESKNSDLSNFETFWTEFKYAVLKEDIDRVIELTTFPFYDGYNDVYNKDQSLTSSSPRIFKKNYHLIFDSVAIEEVKQDNYFRIFNPDQFVDEDVANHRTVENDYRLRTGNDRTKDLVFSKNSQGEFRLSGIAYYP